MRPLCKGLCKRGNCATTWRKLLTQSDCRGTTHSQEVWKRGASVKCIHMTDPDWEQWPSQEKHFMAGLGVEKLISRRTAVK